MNHSVREALSQIKELTEADPDGDDPLRPLTLPRQRPAPIDYEAVRRQCEQAIERNRTRDRKFCGLDDLDISDDLDPNARIEDLSALDNLDAIEPSEVIDAADAIAAPDSANATERTSDSPKPAVEIASADALADLDHLDGESSEGTIIEHLDELDASDEVAVEAAIARSESYNEQAEREPVIKPALRTLMRAYRAKHAPDLLAVDKMRVECDLKKYGLTLDVLPPEFWTWDRDRRNYEYGCIIGPVKRAAKRAKRMEERGYPAGYYDLPDDERHRISARVRSKRYRAKRRGEVTVPPVRLIPAATITRAWRDDMLGRMNVWTKGTGATARQFRGREVAMVRAAMLYHSLCATLRRHPTYGEFAARIGGTRAMAQRRVTALTTLYSGAGPWR